jgi:hypothetical protein
MQTSWICDHTFVRIFSSVCHAWGGGGGGERGLPASRGLMTSWQQSAPAKISRRCNAEPCSPQSCNLQSNVLHGLITVPNSSDPKDRGRAIEEEAIGCEYNRVITSENKMTTEEEAVCHQLVRALDLRWKWLFRPKLLPEHDKVHHPYC